MREVQLSRAHLNFLSFHRSNKKVKCLGIYCAFPIVITLNYAFYINQNLFVNDNADISEQKHARPHCGFVPTLDVGNRISLLSNQVYIHTRGQGIL